MKPRSIAILAVVAALAGCTSEADDDPASAEPGRTVQLGAPGETGRELTPDEIAELTYPAYSDADVAFVQGMIAHHEQALQMTGLVEERTASEDIPRLALRLEVSQQDELGQLTQWLEARGERVPLPGGRHDHGGLPGMLTNEQLSELAAAGGNEFDRLFLEYMILHHEGAIVMVDMLLTGEGGQEPGLNQLANHIDADQRVEIARMKRLLAEMS
jgi:uncharacterized protein (DUF305 family)